MGCKKLEFLETFLCLILGENFGYFVNELYISSATNSKGKCQIGNQNSFKNIKKIRNL